ncbi:MAG: hypothetical protein WA051_01385 [Minisyncoccia bacterium]
MVHSKKDFILLITLLLYFLLSLIGYAFSNVKYEPVQPQNASVDLKLTQLADRSPINAKLGANFASVAKAGSGCLPTLAISSNKPSLNDGDKFTYTVNLLNNGVQSCKETTVQLFFPKNISIASLDANATTSNQLVLGDIKPSVTKKIIINAIYKAPTESISEDSQICVTAKDIFDVCKTAPVNKKNNSDIKKEALLVSSKFSNEKEYGVWVWISPINMTIEYMNKTVDEAVKNNINVIYVTISDYSEIESLKTGEEKDSFKKNYSDSLVRFIRVADEKNIAVDVEAGWRDWAEDSEKHKALAVVDYAIDFNKTHMEKIRSFQYDIEPYLIDSYITNSDRILKNFLRLIDETKKRLSKSTIRLAVVIPHFYDGQGGLAPRITYNNKNKYPFEHLLDILDRQAGSSLILMSYRNFSKGKDGSIEISQNEIDIASRGNHSTKIIVAQEISKINPEFVSFYSKPKSYFLEQVGLIQNTFNAERNFGGMAIHYIEPLFGMK